MNARNLSLCMIVKNEERALAHCLDSTAGLDVEIVVVDTGSTDGTRDIARRYGAQVHEFDFTNADFAAARNAGLARAAGDWILVLDADETLATGAAPLIQQLISRDDNAGYYFERRNYGPDAAAPTLDHAVRLFPNRPQYRYRGRVHETIDNAILAGGGRLLCTPIRIDHDFASDPERRSRRNLWYIGILQEEVAANPDDVSRLDFLAAEYHQAGLFEQAAAVAERIVHLRPLDAEAHLHAGIYRLLSGKDGECTRGEFEQALKLRPGYPEAQAFLGYLEERERAGESLS